VEIRFLAEIPQHAPVLAAKHAQEWAHLYPDQDESAVLTAFSAEAADGHLPATLLALDGEMLLGSVSLIFGDLPSRPDLDPWLASLFVFHRHRGKGVGNFLIKSAMEVFATTGFPTLYVFTENRTSLFAKHGFTYMEDGSCGGHAVHIMKKDFPKP
jgi:GNAT superfamily N-acetyltransferase